MKTKVKNISSTNIMANDKSSKNDQIKNPIKAESNISMDYEEKKLNNLKSHSLKSRKYQIVKETFLEWSSRTDMNNYGKIFDYRGNLFGQIIWILVFLILTGLTAILIQMSIAAYLSYSVTTSYDIIYESPTDFPTITMCFGSPFSTSKGNNLLSKILQDITRTGMIGMPYYGDDVNNLAKMYVSNPSYGDENRQQLGLSINDVSTCKFNNKDCLTDLHWIWSFYYGNCFQFNSGLNLTNQKIDLVQSTRTDPEYGLNIEFSFDYCNPNNGSGNNQPPTLDFIVFVHNSSNRVSSSTTFVQVPLNFKLTLAIERTFFSKIAAPYSDCKDLSSYSSSLYDFIIQTNFSYRQSDCLDLCIQQNIMSECGCYYLKYPSLNTEIDPCLNLSQFNCANNQIDIFESVSCISNSCPLECDSISYESESSLGNFQGYPFFLDPTYSTHTFLNVFYPRLEYTQITEQPETTFINLLTQLGGSIGMFISFSVFTFFETLELFILIVYAWIF